jgi:hypothetical protein
MTRLVYVPVYGFFLLPLAGLPGNNADSEMAPAVEEKQGSSPQNPLSVSLIQLIATPDVLEGKHVRVKGFVKIEFEGTAIYLHREDAEQVLTKNGLWLKVDLATFEASTWAQVKDRYAIIEGQFSGKKKGHKGLWSGSVENIIRMEPLKEIRKNEKKEE